METNEIARYSIEVISHEDWLKINESDRAMATDIMDKINNAHQRINKTKELSEKAAEIRGIFKQRKINSVLAEAQINSSESMSELAELIQQSIRFTLKSVQTASNMQKALAYLAVNGISNTNGRIEKLSDECVESINTIIESANDFIQNQMQIEERQSDLDERIIDKEIKDCEQDSLITELEKSLERSDALRKNQDKIILELQEIISKNQSTNEQKRKRLIHYLHDILRKNSLVNEEQHTKIENLLLSSIAETKDELSRIINLNRDYDEEQRRILREELETLINKKLLNLKITMLVWCGALTILIILLAALALR